MFSSIKRLSQDHWPVFLLSNFSSVINLILPIILVRLLSPEDMGLYKTFFLYFSLIPFLTMAGGPVNSIYYWIGKKESERDDYVKSTWIATLLLSALILIPGTIAAFFFQKHLSLSLGALLIVVVTGFLTCPAGHFSEVCIARGKNFLGSFLALIFETLKICGFLFIAWKYRNVEWIFYYYLVIMLASFLLMNTLGYKANSISLHIDREKVKEILRYSLPISMSAFFIFIIDKADQLIISGLVSPDLFAFYTFGSLVIPPLYLLETSVQKNLIPKLANLYTEENYSHMALQYKKAIADIAYLIIPAIFGLYFYATPIVELLYTKTYLESSPFLQVFALSYFLLLIPHDSILRATGKTKIIMKAYFWLTPFSLLVIFLAAKYLDLRWTLLISIIIKLLPKIYCFFISANIIKAPVLTLIPIKKLGEFFGAAIFLTIISQASKGLFDSELKWFIVTAPLFAVFYLSFFIFRHIRNNA